MFKRFNLFVKRIFNSTNSLDLKNLSKNEIIDCFLLAINTKDVSLLQKVLLIAYKNGLDIDYSDIIIKLLSEGAGKIQKPLVFLHFSAFLIYSHSTVAGGLEVMS